MLIVVSGAVLISMAMVFPPHVGVSLILAALVTVPAAIWLDGRRRIVVLAAIALIAVTAITLMNLFATVTIHVRNDSDQWIWDLSVGNENAGYMIFAPVPPGVEDQVRFSAFSFHGEMDAYGWTDFTPGADLQNQADAPARRFRTTLQLHITADGELHFTSR